MSGDPAVFALARLAWIVVESAAAGRRGPVRLPFDGIDLPGPPPDDRETFRRGRGRVDRKRQIGLGVDE